jgi:hypothetical protein
MLIFDPDDAMLPCIHTPKKIVVEEFLERQPLR